MEKINTPLITVLVILFTCSTGASYFMGKHKMESQMFQEMRVEKDLSYKEGQLDAFNGKQIYEKAVFEDGREVIMERNGSDSTL
jgi:hypothetical protein